MKKSENFERPNFRAHAEMCWRQAKHWYQASRDDEDPDHAAINVIDDMLLNIWLCAHDGLHTTKLYAMASNISEPVESSNTARNTNQRYITTWRSPEDPLCWDYYICESFDRVEIVVENIKKIGAKQYYTYTLGEQHSDFSCDYGKK